MSPVGFIGTGHIAAPMARHLATKGHDICVSRRNADIAAKLAAAIGARIMDNQQVLDTCDIVVICLRPHIADEVLKTLRFRPDHRIISVMAGVPLERLRALCAPATEFEITFPVGCIEQGGCPLPAYPDTRILSELFGPQNPVFAVSSQDALDAYLSGCAFLPGLLDMLATASGQLAEKTGDVAGAEFYLTQLAAGYLSALPRGAGQLACARDGLATPGTYSLAMTRSLHAENVHTGIATALNTFESRMETLK